MYSPLIIIYYCFNISNESPNSIKGDFRVFRQLVKRSGAQVVFSSIFPVVGNNIEHADPADQYMAARLASLAEFWAP